LLAHGRWFSLDTPASSTTKTGRLDIAEILLKVALNRKKLKKKKPKMKNLPNDKPTKITNLHLIVKTTSVIWSNQLKQ
jgi:hypothetical protein